MNGFQTDNLTYRCQEAKFTDIIEIHNISYNYPVNEINKYHVNMQVQINPESNLYLGPIFTFNPQLTSPFPTAHCTLDPNQT